MVLQLKSCKILFLTLSAFVYSTYGQFSCEDFARGSWRNFTINETFEGILESVYISDIEDAEIQSSAHLAASVNADNFLTISVKTNFEDHDDATAKLVIDCTNSDYIIDYFLNIGREACTVLEFNNPYYTYAFYNGLPKDYEFDLNDFERISAKCAQNSIEFYIEENDYFALEIVDDRGSNGEYYATVRTKKDIKAPFDQFFNITAVDSEDPENVATAILEVQISEPEEMSFADSYYWGVIYRDLQIVISNGPIVLTTYSDFNDIEIEILPDYGDFFDVEFSAEDVQLIVSPQRKYEELNDTSVMIILKVRDPYFENTAETIVMLNVSSEILTTVPPVVVDVFSTTTLAPQSENSEQTDAIGNNEDVPSEDENDEAYDGEDEIDGSQQANDNDEGNNEGVDSQEDNKQINDDKDEDGQPNNDDDDEESKGDVNDGEDQKIDGDDDDEEQKVDDDEDQKVDNNDEDQKIDGNDDKEDQKGGDGDEDHKGNGDEYDDYNDDNLVLEDDIVGIEVPLSGLDYWIAHTRAVTIIIIVIASFFIVSAIFYLKSRTPRRQIYMY